MRTPTTTETAAASQNRGQYQAAYSRAWDRLFARLSEDEQAEVLAAPSGQASADLALAATEEAEKSTETAAASQNRGNGELVIVTTRNFGPPHLRGNLYRVQAGLYDIIVSDGSCQRISTAQIESISTVTRLTFSPVRHEGGAL